ncbi:MAG: M35 family metallo-endopeptidase [Candidatus Methylumidiphilus sp.]
MNKFSEAYKAAQDIVKNAEFASVYEKIRVNRLKPLLADGDGPAPAEASALDKLREALEFDKRTLSSTVMKGALPEKACAKAIFNAVGHKPDKQVRVATIKMLKHFYHGKGAGGQSIWVYSPPKAYAKWIFDEVAGASDEVIETVLSKSEEEIYTKSQRAVMCSAIQEARAVALAVVAKLGTPDNATKEVVKQYFSDASTTNIEAIISTLAAGYQKIANVCNSSKIIISDEPLDRNTGGWKDWAFIYPSESMKVIYLQGAWLSKADEITPSNQNPLYRCIRTIIHELSHKEVRTEDVVYGPKGLKPNGSSSLTADYALHNADSWAFFAVDLLDYLTGPDKSNGSKVNTAILKAPTRTLTTA